MGKVAPEEAVKELTLALMYLTRFGENNRFSSSQNNAWKGYAFDVLDKLGDALWMRKRLKKC